ncbi:hypothetical protein BDU57DRAFT_511493 [Ampelomyces quisqualis]|uniref:F-box domain-containing protein n=1 Tax=Ampelomyces quisqualis TaxID=50730 RepID=A0A6A5QW24_AMPQU|nr:hypothetical protein BDU57DRAFT_511493 [Ampelomyces quisqualis]
MQALTRLAFQVDKRLGTETFASLYRKHTFRPDTISAQQQSRFLSFPPEIRLIIYKFVFSHPPCSSNHLHRRTNTLSLLSTCRQIHDEAITPALNNTHFHLQHPHILTFQSTLQSLGPLKNQLRHVHVSIPLQRLNAYTAANPFILTQLPLQDLVIDLGKIEARTWVDENTAYHYFVSAMLYRAAPASACPVALHESLFQRAKRRVAVLLLADWASAEQFYDSVGSMVCREVVVQADRDEKDVLWSALRHFRLVEDCMTLLEDEEGEGEMMYVICGDEGEKSFVEMGVWPPRRWEGG